jgi:hypothetical protein
MQKLEKYVRCGNTAVVTAGFFKECLNRGIKEMTSVRLTGRCVCGNEYWVQPYGERRVICSSAEKIQLDALDYKTNASWCEISLMNEYNSFPLLVHDFYGKGHLYILNVPNDFGDLYSLPKDVVGHINKVFSASGLYVKSSPRICTFVYDNDVIGIYSQKPYADDVEVILPEKYSVLHDIETGQDIKALTDTISRRYGEPLSSFKFVRVNIPAGSYRFFKLT